MTTSGTRDEIEQKTNEQPSDDIAINQGKQQKRFFTDIQQEAQTHLRNLKLCHDRKKRQTQPGSSHIYGGQLREII